MTGEPFQRNWIIGAGCPRDHAVSIRWKWKHGTWRYYPQIHTVSGGKTYAGVRAEELVYNEAIITTDRYERIFATAYRGWTCAMGAVRLSAKAITVSGWRSADVNHRMRLKWVIGSRSHSFKVLILKNTTLGILDAKTIFYRSMVMMYQGELLWLSLNINRTIQSMTHQNLCIRWFV